MEEFNITNNTTQNNSYNNSNDTSGYDLLETEEYKKLWFITYVVTCMIISVAFPLILMAIYYLFSLVRNNHVAPIYIINLLISDLIQLCCMIVWVAQNNGIPKIGLFPYTVSLTVSAGFMVCIALERYLVIACPLWYRFRRNIKTSLFVCVVVWVHILVCLISADFLRDIIVSKVVYGCLFFLPFPLIIFSLVGTLRALSVSRVPSDEKRRIVGILVLVLLIYTLLFMPNIIFHLAKTQMSKYTLSDLSSVFVRFCPLADSFLYVFMRKGTIDKLLASLCGCRMDSNDSNRMDSKNISSSTV
ncbi:G-protein coupled receptor 4-like [Sparus aurata]|uniref:G-protein coupled receptor 4-like n=1 Tax=Sparus aurata TaxID=8175 RepID=UPI0011C11B19|nr:G-protein coupled receptor 4-like [Sparus aurata]